MQQNGLNTAQRVKADFSRAMMKKNWVEVALRCTVDADYWQAVISNFLEDDHREFRHCSEVVRLVCDRNPALVAPYLEALIQKAQHTRREGSLRCVMHCLQTLPIPEEMEGKVYDLCFPLISDLTKPIAVRVFAMTAAYHVALKYPELFSELSEIIRNLLPHEGPAFQNRGAKILSKSFK